MLYITPNARCTLFTPFHFKDEQDVPTGQSRGRRLYIFDARHHFPWVYSTPFLMHRKNERHLLHRFHYNASALHLRCITKVYHKDVVPNSCTEDATRELENISVIHLRFCICLYIPEYFSLLCTVGAQPLHSAPWVQSTRCKGIELR